MDGRIAAAILMPSTRCSPTARGRLGASSSSCLARRHAARNREPLTGSSGSGVAPGKYSSVMLARGGIRTVTAVTANVTTSETKKYSVQCGISPRVFATITMKAAETVEKPVAMIAASRPVYLPCLYTRSVIMSPRE